MPSKNSVEIVGYLGADPEVRTFRDGGRVCNLRVATTEKWKDRATGAEREQTEWHSVVIRGDNLVGIVESFARKGSLVLIEGALKTRKWQDQSGADRYATEIVVAGFRGRVLFLDRAPGGSGRGGSGTASGHAPSDAAGGLDDEIPF